MEETLLIKKLKEGNELAFSKLVDQYQDQVYNTVMGFIRHPEEAQDIAQEVFIEIHQSIARFRGDAQLSTWIYRIAVTKSLDHLRRQKRKKRFAKLTSLFNDKGDLIHTGVEHKHPGIQLENQEQAQILFKAIDSLAENQKIAFVLHKVDGLSHREISEIMSLSLSSVESLLHRAKKKLQVKLRIYYEKNTS